MNVSKGAASWQLPLFAHELTNVIKASERSTDVTIDDHARGEKVEHELDGLIRKRHALRVKTEGHRPSEEMWAASERAYFARLNEEQRLARLAYHQGQAARLSSTLGSLVAYHEGQAEKYRDQPKGAA